MTHQSTSKSEYFNDRFGRRCTRPDDAPLRQRTGVFGITFNERGKLLLTWPLCVPSLPQLPGGGVEPGESLEQALLREYNEEVGQIESITAQPILQQQVAYYADDHQEYWQYQQFYFFVSLQGASIPRYGKWVSPEQAKAAWVSYAPSMALHYIHRRVLNFAARLHT